MSRYYIDASVFIADGSAFGMIFGFVELQRVPLAGSVLPEISIDEFVVERILETGQPDPTVSLKDIVMPSAGAARDLIKRCESTGLLTNE